MTCVGGRGLDVTNVDDVESAISQLLAATQSQTPIRLRCLWALDSTDMGPLHWQEVAALISSEWQHFRAIVIVSGTNTLAYFASALAFALQGIPIPVILTGSQLPVHEVFSDAQMNFANSLRLAEMAKPGVFVVFGHRIIVGSRAKKVSESQLDAFCTFNADDIGEIGIQIRIRDSVAPVDLGKDDLFSVRGQFCPDVICLTVLPGMSSDILENVVSNCRGLILRSFGAGDLPRDLFPSLHFASTRGVPIVNTTQCRGSTMMGLNEIGREALDFGVIQAFDMSMEAMTTKLMWLIGQGYSYEEIREQMHVNLAGEIDVRGHRQ